MSSLLERNLAALSLRSPAVARAVGAAAPEPAVEFLPAADGELTGQWRGADGARALASRRRPRDEAERLVATVDLASAGCVAVAGFGLGYHVRDLALRLGRAGQVIVFEPDLALLRAVLERVDHVSTFARGNVVVVVGADDAGAIAGALRGWEGLAAMGSVLLDHPPSAARLGAAAGSFHATFARAIEAVRLAVVTSLVQVRTTARHQLGNLGRYVTGPGIAGLAGIARGHPAVVVSAGPSLHRNIDLLTDSALRGRVVIIAVQTVLKTLLARGIRPHFVTALDHSAISTRFYEGLSAADVRGSELVILPMAHPAIARAFPGAVRCASDEFLDLVLGPALAPAHGALPAGGTVAHLAYYLARHLGCDPVALVGQDLGFTDGQYYSAGAAIHETWAGELNEFNTLEMLEWQRIARTGHSLRRAVDTLGRPIFTDEQMLTYLLQFERDFKADGERGLTVVDATEGGVAKRHAPALPLRDFLARHAAAGAAPLPRALAHPERDREAGAGGVAPAGDGTAASSGGAALPEGVRAHLGMVRVQSGRLGRLAAEAAGLFGQMLSCQHDQARLGKLLGRVEAMHAEVKTLEPAYALVQRLDQSGTFNRARADRALSLSPGLAPLERQRRELERDLASVTGLAENARVLAGLLDEALGDGAEAGCEPGAVVGGVGVGVRVGREPPRRAWGLICLDPGRSGLGLERALAEPFVRRKNALRLTLERLARCRLLAGVVLATDNPALARSLAGPAITGLDVRFHVTATVPLADRRELVRAARLWCPGCWRGGLGNLTCWDEVFDAPVAAEVMRAHDLTAVVVVGSDWCLIDPGLTDAVIARWDDSCSWDERRLGRVPGPLRHLVFCPAPPGLAPCLLTRPAVESLAAGWGAGARASIGGLMAYIPGVPMPDPLGLELHVPPPAEVRDALARFIPDSPERRAGLAAALALLPGGGVAAGALEVVRAVAATPAPTQVAQGPAHLVLELCTGRRTSGRRGHWERGSTGTIERPPLTLGLAASILEQFGASRPDGALTLGGAGDPLLHPELARVLRLARECGVAAVHLRTDLVCDAEVLEVLLDSGLDVVSVDLMAENPGTYAALMGGGHLASATRNLEHLLARRGARGSGRPWIVPRMTRCDAAYGDVESFFERWTRAAGWCVIDPLPLALPGQRIGPLPRPERVEAQAARRTMTVLCDGSVPVRRRDPHGASGIANLATVPLGKAWRTLLARRAGAQDRAA
ncbi:MAG TPA: 6-hydroxymethylpterin diphosphokinase MptE-like protein [Phycisphaerales bacterium]|nr:6-hydroxymethylpterin diphosphokinase MptE-like protein [Phycisphaerales bacterium]